MGYISAGTQISLASEKGDIGIADNGVVFSITALSSTLMVRILIWPVRKVEVWCWVISMPKVHLH